jgi:hypothetical protein
MKSFRGKAAVDSDNSRLVKAKGGGGFCQWVITITDVIRKWKGSEKLGLCRPVAPEVIRTYM